MYQKIAAKFTNSSFIIIAGLCALLPLLFLPASAGGILVVKGFLLYVGVFLAVSLWLVAQFIDGTLRISRSPVILALGAWVVLSLISALTSTNSSVSLWGRGFVFDSFSTTLVLSLFVFMVATFAREERKLVKLFLVTFSGAALTVFLQCILYVSQKIPFVANNIAHVANLGTLVGSWVDFTYFVTFVFLLALLMYEVLIPKGFFRILSFITMVVSLITLIFLNFKTAWIVAIASSLLVFVYKSSVERSLQSRMPKIVEDDTHTQEEKQHFPIMSLVSLLIGLFFFISSSSVGAALSQYAGISFNDVRPSFSTTTGVMRSALSKDPLFGMGAGQYNDVWNLYHPVSINQTTFWNSPFEAGFNLIQSIATTNGLLPIAALLVVLVLALIQGFKLFNSKFNDRFTRFIAVTSLIMILAFVMLILFASPGIVLITFGFIYIGLLVGVTSIVGRTGVTSMEYLTDPRVSFFAILLLVLTSMAGFSAVYFSSNKFYSVILYNKAVNAKEVSSAENYLSRALLLSNSDVYWKARTALYTNQFSTLATKENPDKTELQSVFTKAEQSAQAALTVGRQSAENWLALSQIYQLVANASATEALTNATTAAQEAQKRSPYNPLFRLNNARINLIKKDTTAALTDISQALELKPNYIDAFIMKGQIGQSTGDTGAIKDQLVEYVAIAPYDMQGYMLLGSAYISLKEYPLALTAFSRAKALNPTDVNAQLSYIGTLELAGEKIKAVEELRAFKLKFPNVQGVDDQITRIQSGTPASVSTEPSTTN